MESNPPAPSTSAGIGSNPTTSSASASVGPDPNATQTRTQDVIQQFLNQKHRLHGLLNRKRKDDFLIGPAIIEIERAFGLIQPRHVDPEEYERLQSQAQRVIEKAMRTMVVINPSYKDIQTLYPLENKWRQQAQDKWEEMARRGRHSEEDTADETMLSATEGENTDNDAQQNQNFFSPSPEIVGAIPGHQSQHSGINNPPQPSASNHGNGQTPRQDHDQGPLRGHSGQYLTSTTRLSQNAYGSLPSRPQQQRKTRPDFDQNKNASHTRNFRHEPAGNGANLNPQFAENPSFNQNRQQQDARQGNGPQQSQNRNSGEGSRSSASSHSQPPSERGDNRQGDRWEQNQEQRPPTWQQYQFDPQGWYNTAQPHQGQQFRQGWGQSQGRTPFNQQPQTTWGPSPHYGQVPPHSSYQRTPYPQYHGVPGYQSPLAATNQQWRDHYRQTPQGSFPSGGGNRPPAPGFSQQSAPQDARYGGPRQSSNAGAHPQSQQFPNQHQQNPSPGSLNLAGYGYGQPWDTRPLEQRLYDDIYAQQQLDFPPNWQLPPPGHMPPAYRYVDAEKAITRGMIKPFAGTIDDYPRFQQSFYTLIHIQPGPIFHKILALDKLITDDSTVATFKGLGMSASDYVTRIQRLERDYGGPERTRSHQLRVLRHLPETLDSNITTVRSYNQALETYLLNSGPEEVYNMVLLQLIKERMTKTIRNEYNAYRNTNGMPDNNQTLSWYLHFKTMNETDTTGSSQYFKGNAKFQGDKSKKKSSPTSGAQKQTQRDAQPTCHDDYDSDDSEDCTYVAQATGNNRNQGAKGNAGRKNKTNQAVKEKCFCCDQDDHIVQNCERFYLMKPGERRALAATKEICFLCLQTGHRSNGCPRKEYRKCGICKKRHHFLLHPPKQPEQAQVNETIDVSDDDDNNWENQSEDSDSSYLCCAYQQARKPQLTNEPKPLDIAITYVTVWIKRPGTQTKIKVNLLADSGANNCSLDTNLAKELGLSGPKEPYHVQVGGGRVNTYSSFTADLVLQGVQPGAQEYTVRFHVYKTPCGPLAPINWAHHKKEWPHLQKLDLPDAATRSVDGIVGMAEPWLLAALEPAITGKQHEPIATKTRLGWCIGGRVRPKTTGTTSNFSVTFVINSDSPQHDLESTKKALERFWEPDGGLPSKERIHQWNEHRRPEAEKRAMQVFDDSVTRLPDGKYEVGLLWKNANVPPYNYRQALRMFYVLENQMKNNECMRKQFNATIEDWINKRIAHYLSPDSKLIKYVLPTFMVVRTDKTTSAYRLVVDGARRFSGSCINDLLLPGPSLIHHIFDVLCRMRLGRYVMTCDVQLMYLNVKVPERDQAYLCLFFREHEDKPLRVVQLSSHPFGLASSPYVAMRAVLRHAQLRKQQYPLAAQAVAEHVIVDDFIVAGDNENVLKETLVQLQALLQEIGMGIHKVASNSAVVINTVEPDKVAKSVELGEVSDSTQEHQDGLPTIKTLGVIWNAKSDQLRVGFKPKYLNSDLTLRNIVSDGGRLFDPLGLVLPVTMGGRLLQQACWAAGGSWDTKLPIDLQNRWKAWAEQASGVDTVTIMRPIARVGVTIQKQRLVVFVDASAEAQAVAVYVQTLMNDGELEARILAAKGRVSSARKQESIPRLECAAAAMGAELTEKINKATHNTFTDAVYLSDSMTTLWWIKAAKPLKTYVANRLCTILDTSTPSQWRHVPTDQNPADLPTRTLNVAKLKASDLWKYGPEFLRYQEKHWPAQPALEETTETKGEVKDPDKILDKINVAHEIQPYSQQALYLRKIWGQHSSPAKGWNVTSYMYQFYVFMKGKTGRNKNATVRDIDLSQLRQNCLTVMLRQEQEAHLHELLKALNKEQTVPTRFACWRPFKGDDDLVRINGRASHVSYLPIESRYQVLLTKAMPLAFELMRLHHEETLQHCGGPRQLLATVRNKFWVENGLTLAKRAVRQCARCMRQKFERISPQTAPLHESRHLIRRPFANIGIDMFGPMEIKLPRANARGKRYGIIFACTFTRAINIEVVTDASARACYLAFRRHVAVYGQPLEINSDRGTNFQHVRKVLRDIDVAWEDSQPSIQQHFPQIKWIMNPPRTPSFGGHYESLIKTIKNTFKTLVKWPKYSLTEEELVTSLKEAGAYANMRPVGEMGDSPDDGLPLRPSDFLNTPVLGTVPDDQDNALRGHIRTGS